MNNEFLEIVNNFLVLAPICCLFIVKIFKKFVYKVKKDGLTGINYLPIYKISQEHKNKPILISGNIITINELEKINMNSSQFQFQLTDHYINYHKKHKIDILYKFNFFSVFNERKSSIDQLSLLKALPFKDESMFLYHSDQVIILGKPRFTNKNRNCYIQPELICQGNYLTMSYYHQLIHKRLYYIETFNLAAGFIMFILYFINSKFSHDLKKKSPKLNERNSTNYARCSRCLKNGVNVVNLECGHFVICSTCYLALDRRCFLCGLTYVKEKTFLINY